MNWKRLFECIFCRARIFRGKTVHREKKMLVSVRLGQIRLGSFRFFLFTAK